MPSLSTAIKLTISVTSVESDIVPSTEFDFVSTEGKYPERLILSGSPKTILTDNYKNISLLVVRARYVSDSSTPVAVVSGQDAIVDVTLNLTASGTENFQAKGFSSLVRDKTALIDSIELDPGAETRDIEIILVVVAE